MAEHKKQWIEQELEASLRRVSAPAELWERIQSRQPSGVYVRTRFMAWATVPIVMFVALWGPHPRSGPALQIRSGDPAEIRAWVKANTGLDVPLHPGNLAGANIVSARTAEIAYQDRGRSMSLVVSTSPPSLRKNGNAVSWSAGGQTYLLDCAEPQDLKACTLCHVGG